MRVTRYHHDAPPPLRREWDPGAEATGGGPLDAPAGRCGAALRSILCTLLTIVLSVTAAVVVVSSRGLRKGLAVKQRAEPVDAVLLPTRCPSVRACPALQRSQDEPPVLSPLTLPHMVVGPADFRPSWGGPDANPLWGRVHFITYGDDAFARSRNRLVREASAFPVFSSVRGFARADIDPVYARRNAALLAGERGGGWWAWKSHFLYRTLAEASDGDVVFYMDAGSTFRRDPTPIVELAARYGAFTARIGHAARVWTKGVVFEALGMPMSVWGGQPQIAAGLIVLQRRAQTLALAREFAELSQNATLITDEVVPGVPNHAQFRDHRHDQSLWTLLCYKHGVQLVMQGNTMFDERPIITHTRVHG